MIGLLENYGALGSSPKVFDELTDDIVPRTPQNVNKDFKRRMMRIARSCVQEDPQNRPTMHAVLDELREAVASLGSPDGDV